MPQVSWKSKDSLKTLAKCKSLLQAYPALELQDIRSFFGSGAKTASKQADSGKGPFIYIVAYASCPTMPDCSSVNRKCKQTMSADAGVKRSAPAKDDKVSL